MTRPQPQDIIASIAATSSRLDKEAILKSAADQGLDEFFEGLKLCYNNLITFGVKEVPESDNATGQGLSWVNFLELAQALRKRELTGHAARDAINLAIGVATQDQWNGWYRRILIKDMRAGFTATTVNKVAKAAKKPEYSIPVFACQLASDANEHTEKLRGRVLCDYKYDGTRALVFLDHQNHTVSIFSRNGIEFHNFGHIQRAFEPLIDVFARDTVIDGEVVSANFQALMKQARRKTDADASDAKFMVFDIIPAFEFTSGRGSMSQRARRKFLEGYAQVIAETGVAELVDQHEFDLDTEQGRADLDKFFETAVAAGLEGIMVKNSSAVYECKRGTNWLKIKPSISLDMKIVAVEPGTGRNQDRLGALVCEGEYQGNPVRSNVGSGFSDQQRDDIWRAYLEDSDQIIGHIAEVAADSVTKNQNATDLWSLRFPRFLRFRDFTAGVKV